MKNNKFLSYIKRILKACLFPVLSIVTALVLGGVITKIMGYNTIEAYKCLLNGSFGTFNAFGETIIKAIPLIFTGISFAVAVRSGIVNLGAEGQLYIGALVGTVIATSCAGLPSVIHIPLVIIGAFLGGAIYGSIIVILKNRFGASELITTIMFNYIAIELVSFFISGPIEDKIAGQSFPQSCEVLDSAKLPVLFKGTRLHAGIFIAILALIIFGIFMWKTTRGFQLRVVGRNPVAASISGMDIKKNSLLSMFLAGGFAGVGGAVEIIAVQLRLIENFSNNYGFDGVAVALLGANNPVGIFLSAILFGALNSGSHQMEMLAKVPSAVVKMIQGLIILCVVGRAIFKYFKKPEFISKLKKKGIQGQWSR